MNNVKNLFLAMQSAAEKRVKELVDQHANSLEWLEKGDPLGAESGSLRINAANKRSQKQFRRHSSDVLYGAEAKKGERNNFIPVSFLATGAQVARAVAQVDAVAIQKVGTGFMCAPGLFITNSHVIPNKDVARSAIIKFDYVFGDGVAPTHFRLDPDRCFVADDVTKRDYAIIAVGPQIDGSFSLEEFGWCPLSSASNKHSLGEFANIIQHPEGEPKQVVLQDNLIAARHDFVLHYYADTEVGSSGSPVFNNDWQVIAIHHWGKVLHMDPGKGGYHPDSVNEGIRISQIVEHVREQRDSLPVNTREEIVRLLSTGFTKRPSESQRHFIDQRERQPDLAQRPQQSGIEQRTNDGKVTWTIPLEVSVSLPGLGSTNSTQEQPAQAPKPINQSNDDTNQAREAEATWPLVGEGYRPDFLNNHIVPLPKVMEEFEDEISPLLDPDRSPSAKLGELQFTHFSTVVSRIRKLPLFGACNVDGKSLFAISSSEQTESQYDDVDEYIFAASRSGAEGAHSWRPDRRILTTHQIGKKWYSGENKLKPRAGTDDAEKYIAVADFDRGHMVRRTEPIWGTSDNGQAANRQTYNFANAAPQTPVFNQNKDRTPAEIDEGEEKRSWYGMEVAILRAATNEDLKMNVFTGPIFEESDPIYGPGKVGGGNCQVPLTFWKIAVWEQEGELKSIAMKYSQEFTLLRANEAESLNTAGELFLLRDFLTTVQDIQNRTGIDFGKKVGKADILKDYADDFSDLQPEDFLAMVAN